MPPEPSLADEVARLYALAPDEFVAARNAAAKACKQSGRNDDAAALAALRKPSVIQHALNQAAHRDPATTRAWADAARRADEAQSATIGGADAAALRTAVAELRAATAAMVDAAAASSGAETKRDGIAALLRELPVGAVPQVVAGVLGSAVLPVTDLFAGAPTPPRRARPARDTPTAAKSATPRRPPGRALAPAPGPPPARPSGPSARERKLASAVERQRIELAAVEAELVVAHRAVDDAQRRVAEIEAQRSAAAAALEVAEAELAAETAKGAKGSAAAR